MTTDIAHIVYASDERFAEILGVSLISLYENSKDMEDIVVYVLDNNISEKNKRKIGNISKTYGRNSIKWIVSKDVCKELSVRVKLDRGSISQFSRLFVSSLVPENLDRILYLDCDVIINKSIRELWNLDLHGMTIAASMDAFSPLYRMNIDLNRRDVMFNSGVLLIDINMWKNEKIEDQLLSFINYKKGKVPQGDQGALNAVLSRKTFCFEPRFNSVTIFHDFDYEEMMIYRKPPEGFYGKSEIKQAVEDPNIIHYTTSFLSMRPWSVGCQHRYVDKWLYYKALSPWKSNPLWKDSRSQIKYFLVRIMMYMPRSIMIRICGILQAYIRPLFYRIL